MPDTTSPDQTTTYPAGITADTIADGPADIITADGEVDFSALGITVRTVTNKTVDIPPHIRRVFAAEVAHFSGLPNTAKRELTFPNDQDAAKYRAQLASYASEMNLVLALPKDAEFGRKPNAGALVTYRLGLRSDEPGNGPVVLSEMTDVQRAKVAAAKAAREAAQTKREAAKAAKAAATPATPATPADMSTLTDAQRAKLAEVKAARTAK